MTLRILVAAAYVLAFVVAAYLISKYIIPDDYKRGGDDDE